MGRIGGVQISLTREGLPPDERRQRLLRLIPFISFEEVQDGKVESILDGTGHWLLSNEAFAKWRSATEPTLLWVYGKHGCGKSHLAARVIDDLKSSYDLDRPRDATATAIAYVYCSPQDLGGTSSKNPSRASGEPNRIDLANLLGSILRQIVAQLPLSVDVPLRARLESKAEAPTGREMREMIKATIALFPQVFLVVDGLDECQNLPENQFEGLCRYLRSLATTGASSACAKVIVFSRPEYPEIDKAFAGCASVQVDAGANDNDIKEFIAHRVSSLKKAPPVLEEIRGVIFERADGMFLWVHLLVKALKELRTTKKVKEAVKNIPVGLDTVYALSMERIWGQSPVVREQAMKALLWVANAMRPLSRRELLDALSTEPDTDYLDEESRIDDDSGLAAECADLIILKNDQYHLLHSSLKDYLDSLAPSSPGLEEYQILQSRGERILASTCLTYLGFKPFRIGPVSTESELKLLLESNPLLEYAACYWGEHLSRAKVDAHDELSDRARCFLRSDKARDLSLQASRLQKPSSPFINLGATSPLHALAVFKLRFIAESLEDCEAMISETDSLGFFPMDYAMITTNHEMSAWFLIKCSESGTVGSSVESFPSKLPLLHLAAENGWEDITTKLIVLGFDVDSDPDGIGTPLHCAAESGKKSAVQVLLRAGANINALNKDGRTPLLLAASNAHNEVVDILLQNGADVKITGRDKTTVLHYVARNSDAALTQKVLEMGADIDSRGGSEVPGGTPLHYSVNNDVAEVVSVLLDDGASTEARTNQGNTPLLLACSWGRPSCLRVLLQRGAQSGVQNNANESAFHLAAQDGHADILQILLNDPPALVFLDVLNKSGNTPLISAIIRGQTAACKVLLDHGARTDVVNSIARPPLHVAIEFGELEIGMTLMEQYGADVKQLGLNGETTLQCAARFGRIEWIPLLLSRSVDPEKQDVYGDRAVHRAVDNGQLAFLKELVAARPGLNLLAKNKRGNTPLHKASWLSELGVAQFLVNQFRYEHGIAENPTNCAESSERGTGMPTPGQLSRALHDTDEHGRTALHFAAASGGPVLEYLLQQGADVNTVDRFGHTALVSAIGTKKTEAAKLLLTYNVDLTLTDKQGKCALVFAIEGRLVGLVGILLDKYVDAVSIPDIRGGRALHYAACCGHPQILDSVAHVQEDVSHQVDCLGWDALCYAATFGHAQLIEPLMHLGMGPDGSPIADESPLGVAIDLGHLVFAKRLLEKKANIDSPTGPLWRQPPLHRALLRGRLHTAKVLLKAGANPTVRDVFGLSALDHASEDVEIRSALESRIPGFRPLPLVDRSRRLRSIVAACSSALKDLDLASADSRADYRRVENLICLAYTLLRLERKKDADNANLCFTELSNKAAQPTAYCATMRCRICGTCPIVDRTRYICKRCPRRVELCSKCFHAFIDPEVASSRGRDALKELRQYETDANKLRVLLEPLLHTGVERIERVISNPSLRWRLKPRLELYDAWMRKHNASGQFLPKAIPGWQLLKLLEKAHNVRKQIDAEAQDAKSKKDEGTVESKKTADGKKKETSTSEHHGEATKTTDGPSNGSPWDSINAELLELYADHRPNWDEATFNCFEHSFMEVHDGLDLLSDEAKTNFDSNGRLISAFFQRLEEEYSSESKSRVLPSCLHYQAFANACDSRCRPFPSRPWGRDS